jgi:hypothetical protein
MKSSPPMAAPARQESPLGLHVAMLVVVLGLAHWMGLLV